MQIGCLGIIAIIGGIILYLVFETNFFLSLFSVVFILTIVAVIYNILEEKFGYKDFANEKDEKELEKLITIIVVVISAILCEIFQNFWVFIIPLFACPVIIFPLSKYLLRKSNAKAYYNSKVNTEQQINLYTKKEDLLDKIDCMNGQDFELFLINKLLPLDGYININGTSYTGDFGVDIIAEKNGIKCAIQCKRFNNKVSTNAIQEIVAGRKHYKCDKAIVITNSYYTKNAKELAFDNKVELLNRDYIIKMVKKLKDANK